MSYEEFINIFLLKLKIIKCITRFLTSSTTFIKKKKKKITKRRKRFFIASRIIKRTTNTTGGGVVIILGAECKQVVVLAAVTYRSNLCTHYTYGGGEEKGSCGEDGTASTIDDEDEDDGHYCVYGITYAHDILIRDRTYVHR